MKASMFKVYYINHQYYAQDEFNTREDAINYGKSKGFEFKVDFNGKCVASWGPISGLNLNK